MQQRPWPASLTQITARQVRRLRQQRGVSAERLAEEVSELGVRYTRGQVSNLESGRRDSITVGEILAFAAAFGVPPALLLFPVGADEQVEYLPGMPADAWQAYRFLAGDQLVSSARGEDGQLRPVVEAQSRSNVVETYRRHDAALWRWMLNRDANPRYAERGLVQLYGVRADMREQGWWLPPLPEGLDEQVMHHALPTIDLEQLDDGGRRP
jgi:transcriptional regulator with XRE-family HTH domain